MKTVKNILRAISLALALFASSAPASERIMSMDVTGIVSADAHLTVTEKLRVRVENVDIRHGIIRDFPTEYTGSDGASYSTDFEFVSAEIDGRPASVSVSRRGGTAEMRIGDPNAYLRRGEREISVTYRTLGWIAFRESFDELYWNVTGNEWEFPIDRASFKLALPPGGVISQIAAYTGKTGRQGADWKSTKDGVISTTRALAPGEGLTVVYAWNKGVVTPPRVSWYRRLGEPFFAAGIAAAVFLYYFAAWYMVGRDPAARRIIPLYRPPKGVEPGFARYLKDLRFSDDCIAADIIQLATLGFVRFSGGEDARNLTIEATDDASDNEALAALPDSLASVMSSIFPAGRRREIEVDSAGGSVFNDAAERLKRVYGARAREYFRKNTVFSAMGMIFFLPFFLVVPSALIRMIFFLPMGSNLGVWTIAILAAMTKRSKQFIKIIVKVLGLLLAVLFIAGLALALRSHTAMLVGLLAAAAAALFFSRIMSAYTVEGARTVEEIKGLEMYMNTAERHRLAMIYKPEETPQMFETLLPYAYALGCAKTWADSFANILAKASYTPSWDGTGNYGGGWTYSHSMFSRLSNGISSSISNYHADQARKSASSSSSSSYRGGSGFSGGSSGRGGGGGGGRGW